jgi:hypothetical protein
MSDRELLAPLTGHYEELNVFGTPTGTIIPVRAGERLPGQPRGFTWQLRREPLPQGVSTPSHDPEPEERERASGPWRRPDCEPATTGPSSL